MENLNSKPVIYQLFVRLFGNKNNNNQFFGSLKDNGCGKFNDINSAAIKSIKDLGATHIWLTGVLEHALCTDYSQFGIQPDNPAVVKGKAGSPYAIKNYYRVNPDLAENPENRMDEFMALTKRCHEQGMKVIIDFVPNHVARQYDNNTPEGIEPLGSKDDSSKAFDPQNNFYYLPGQKLILPDEIKHLPYVGEHDFNGYNESPAKVTGNDCFSNTPSYNDWYETVKLNYGVDYQNNKQCYFDPIPDTWLKMSDILLYWLEKGIDGFRCDMAEMVPVEFWNFAITNAKEKFPNAVFIAEIYNPDAYKNYIENGKFDLLYDKEGLYNTLRDIIEENRPARMITTCWQNLHGLDDKMLRFIENHDEQRLASSHFAETPWPGIPAMTLCTSFNKGGVMLYFGQELGEPAEGAIGYSGDDGKTSIFDYCAVPQIQAWMNNGLFDGAGLNDDQIKLRKKHERILALAKRPEVVEGHFYDLMWFNPDNEEFNGKHIYTYLRHLDNNITLFILNFYKESPLRIRIKFPPEIFETIGIDDYFDLFGKDLLSSEKMFTCDKNEILKDGVVIIAEPNSAYAFELEFLMK